MSVNKVQLIGHLGDDPEIRYLPNGTPTTSISVATSETWKDKVTGERKESTEWHRVIFFKGLAEVAKKYLGKGAQVYIEGRIRTRKWTDKNGIDRYITEIIATDMRMLDKKQNSESDQPAATQSPDNNNVSHHAAQSEAPPPEEDEAPFWQ